MKSRMKNETVKTEQQSDDDHKTLKTSRDYISMRAFHEINKRKGKKLNQAKIEKHSLTVHQHLQPEQPEQEADDNQSERDVKPVTLLKEFSKENYKKYIKTVKDQTENELPYREESQSLLDALSTKTKNVCVYGFGSKIQYLRNLVETYFGDHYVWQVNGYKNTLNDKKVYNNFGKFLVETELVEKIKNTTKDNQLKEFREILNQSNLKKPLIVLFHCIDSLHFLNEDSQLCLSLLFELPKIKLICSIDTIKIATVWHPKVKTNYNFRFIQVNTKKPYVQQQVFRPNATDVRQHEEQAIMSIFASLNNNQKKIVKIFAKRELENSQKQNPEQYTLDILLEECIDNVILSNETQLRENLLEILDHQLIVPFQKKSDADRIKKYYYIKAPKAVLDKICRQKIED